MSQIGLVIHGTTDNEAKVLHNVEGQSNCSEVEGVRAVYTVLLKDFDELQAIEIEVDLAT